MNDNILVELVNEKIKNNHDVRILRHSTFRGIDAIEFHGYTWERVLGKFWGTGVHSTHYIISHNGQSISFKGENDYINSLRMLYKILKSK